LALTSAFVHAFITGTDGRRGIGLVVIIACACVVISSALWRYLKRPARALGRTALSPLAPQVDEAKPPKSNPKPSNRRNKVRR
jgi:peptidoglycan/LPS O-acetylase OafA/YrhL